MSTSGQEAMYSAVASFPSQIESCASILDAVEHRAAFVELRQLGLNRVVCCGMGGSAFPMDLLRVWLKGQVSIEIHRDYPAGLAKVEPDTLYLLLSFSGNTEEVLACADALYNQNARLCAVTNGGMLAQWSKTHGVLGVNFPTLPTDFQPRCASGYFLGLVAGTLDRVGITSGLFDQLSVVFGSLRSLRGELEAQAHNIAKAMVNATTFILGYPEMAESVGQIGRIKFNENAKVSVVCDALPEFNHNQMVAMGLDQGNLIAVLLLCDDRIIGRRAHRMSVCERYFNDFGVKTIRLDLPGDSRFMSVLAGVWLLDFASLVLAEMRGVDPQEIGAIEDFKKRLNG